MKPVQYFDVIFIFDEMKQKWKEERIEKKQTRKTQFYGFCS